MPVSKSFNPPQVGDRTIEDFKSTRLSGGNAARPNLFEVELAFPKASKSLRIPLPTLDS